MANLSHCLAGGKRTALLIAVQDTRVDGYDFPKLIYSHRDAIRLQSFLESFGYNVKLMMVDDSIPRELLPTKTNIRKQIELFVQDVSAGDRLFFWYSGHGHQVTCRHYTERDGLDEGIYTYDGKQIIDNDLKKWLVNPLPRGSKLFALWDSCHSATMLDLDHDDCNSPSEHVRHFWESIPLPILLQDLPNRFRKRCIPPFPKNAFTIACHELRGRPVARTSVTHTVSAGNSPLRPFSCYFPFTGVSQLVRSPSPRPKCNGKCPFPTQGDMEYAHVISLSACKDNEVAIDDRYNCGTFTTFFIEHLRENPKSTLRELLLAIRKRVDEITTARREWDRRAQIISRQSTFSNGLRTKPKLPVRRKTLVGDSVEEYLQLPSPRARTENGSQFSQKPTYSSPYRLNLDEPVDL